MTYHEQAGFLRDDPPAGMSTGALVVTGITGSGGTGDASAAKQDTQIGLETTTRDNVIAAVARLQEIRDRLPAALDVDGGLLVHVTNGAGGGLTDTQLRASPVPVSGPLTDTQLRASAVPVSGSGVFHVDDNAGSLTVDSAQLPAALAANGGLKIEGVASGVAVPVSGIFFQATQPVSLATNTPDVTDRAARLLGHVTVDNASLAVTGPLTDTQLRASAVPVSGPLTDTQLRASAVTVDESDRAAREVGRVRIWDGTDEATVLPLRTQPATTEKLIPHAELPTRLPTYGVTIATQTPAITIGVKNLLDLWHPNTVTQDVYVVEVWATCLVATASTTGGRTTVRLSKITAAPTGGTNLTAGDLGGAGASALGTAGNLMQVKTGGGTVGVTFIRKQVEFATNPIGRIDVPVFIASTVGNGIILRGGAADGICVDIEREVAHTALVDTWTVGMRWIEL